MTEPQISPLARRLAEENSIDWRVIPGTGPESRVIERDILTYLARIMSGEIDPPALPDASEPPAPGGAAPDLSEVSNLAAASAGMAKEGIDLSSLLGGATLAVGAALAAPVVAATAFVTDKLNVAPAPVGSSQAEPLDFHTPSPEALPSEPLFSETPPSSATDFSAAPAVAFEKTPLEQISFGDSPAVAPAAFQSPILFGDPTPSASPAKVSPSDSAEAEFEIDLDDFDDVPPALEATEPASGVAQIAAPEFAAFDYSFAQTSDSTVDDGQLPVFESPDLTFDSAQAAPDGHQADLVLDVDSTSEAPLIIAALDASSGIADDLVMADVSTGLETNVPAEAFNLEPVHLVTDQLEPVQLEPVQLEPVQLETDQLETDQLEPVHLEPAQLEPASAAASIAPIQHDDFELDLIDADELTVTPALESIEPAHVTAPLEPIVIAGGAAAAALVGGMLTSTPPLEPVASLESAPPEEAVAHVAQPVAALEAAQLSAAAQLSTAAPSSSVVGGFFQGFAARRHFDASGLTKMQHELVLALNGREVPLAVFLARAAQRNLHALGTGDVVTLTRLGDTLEPLQASGLHHSFIEAVQSVARATPGTMDGLLILDASSLGADDLVLPGVSPVLTLNVKGEHGHLALSGDVPMGKAAEFLSKVALALETPVSLVI